MTVTWFPLAFFILIDSYYDPVTAGYQCTHFTDEAAPFRLITASTSSSSRGKLEDYMLDWTKKCFSCSIKSFVSPKQLGGKKKVFKARLDIQKIWQRWTLQLCWGTATTFGQSASSPAHPRPHHPLLFYPWVLAPFHYLLGFCSLLSLSGLVRVSHPTREGKGIEEKA